MKRTVLTLLAFTSLLSCSDDFADSVAVVVSTEKVEAESNEAISTSIKIQTEGKWYVSEQIDWCTIDPLEGVGSATITLDVDENSSPNDRSQFFHVFTATDKAKVEITQPGKYIPPVITDMYLDFTNDAGYMQVADNPILNIASDESFTACMRLKTTTGGRVITRREGKESGFDIYLNGSGKIAVTFEDDAGNSLSSVYSAKSLSDGKWHDLAVVFDRTGGHTCIYIDGVQDAYKSHPVISSSAISSNQAVLFGVKTAAGASPLSGAVDEVKFYKRAFTLEDATAVLGGNEDTDQIFAHWTFNTIFGSQEVIDGKSGLVGELLNGATLSLENESE